MNRPGSISPSDPEAAARLGADRLVDDDPVMLARLDAIMSDHIEGCPVCGRDPHTCRAIGCDDGASGSNDRTEDRGPRLLVASLS